jgi:3-oxoacyl-[acyl-carrier protein] reductase
MGLGEGIARKFVFEGANVLLFDIDGPKAESVASSLSPGSAIAFKGDATSQTDWDAAAKLCLEKFGALDIVVNNAGVVHRSGVSRAPYIITIQSDPHR